MDYGFSSNGRANIRIPHLTKVHLNRIVSLLGVGVRFYFGSLQPFPFLKIHSLFDTNMVQYRGGICIGNQRILLNNTFKE